MVKEKFIRAKYMEKRYLTENPMVAPATKETDQDTPIDVSRLLLEVAHTKNENTLVHAVDLVARGADPNYTVIEEDGKSATPLHAAAALNNVELVEYLIQNGADVFVQDSNGLEPKDVAEQYENLEVMDLLERYTAKAVSRLAPASAAQRRSRLSRQSSSGAKYLSGWLVKQSGRDGKNRWNKRWCVLDFDGSTDVVKATLKYFKSPEHKEPSGTIVVEDMLEVTGITGRTPTVHGIPGTWTWCFELHTWSRVYIFVAETQSEMIRWVEQLQDLLSLKARKKAFVRQSLTMDSPAAKRVFGVDLLILASRRQGSRDRGVPLFISKTMVCLDHLWQEEIDKTLDSLVALNEGEISGIPRLDIMNLVKALKEKFDADDEKVDLGQEYGAWKKAMLAKVSAVSEPRLIALAFVRVLVVLVLTYLGSIPTPVVSETVFEKLAGCIGTIRASVSTSRPGSRTSVYMDQSSPRNSPRSSPRNSPRNSIHLECSPMFYGGGASMLLSSGSPILSGGSSLLGGGSPIRSGSPRGIELDDQITSIPEGALRGLPAILRQLPDPNYCTLKHMVYYLNRMYRSSVATPVARAELAKMWAASLCGHSKISTASSPGSVVRDQHRLFLLELMIHHSEVVFSSPPPPSSSSSSSSVMVATAMETTTGTVAHKVTPPTSPEQAARYPLSPTTPATTPATSTTTATSTNTILMRGWMHKEGLSVRSWRKRYFLLKPDYLYYYKEEQCTPQSYVGKLMYREQMVRALPAGTKQCPTPYALSIRAPPPTSQESSGAAEQPAARYLCVDSAELLQQWVTAMGQQQQQQQ